MWEGHRSLLGTRVVTNAPNERDFGPYLDASVKWSDTGVY